MKMMTRADICTELGWTDAMIHSLLRTPDSANARRCKDTGEYTYGLYKRERVLAAAQTTEGRADKRQWDETLRGDRPHPGWTTRLGDVGRALGITAVAAGKLLEQLGYRFDKHVTCLLYTSIENVPSRSSFPFLIPHENSSDCMRCDISIPTARKFLYKRRND